MRAIHNEAEYMGTSCIVVPDVKDTNLWEQFTTCLLYLKCVVCCSWCQRYELMRAIHNTETFGAGNEPVVPDVKDTNLWEQFTTPLILVLNHKLLFLMSKIRTYESNSQLCIFSARFGISCSWCQRYELMRAIHNRQRVENGFSLVVPDVKDTNLWEQFTTFRVFTRNVEGLFLMSKIRTYESNSQLSHSPPPPLFCCSWCQRYELMRAIHNIFNRIPSLRQLFLMSKIRTYESNSQLLFNSMVL